MDLLPLFIRDKGYYELERLPGNCINSYIHGQDAGELYTNVYSVDVKGTGAGEVIYNGT